MTHGPETVVKVVPLPEEWRGRFVSLIDVLLRIRSEHARGRPLGVFFGGMETTQAVAAFETGYRACCRYHGMEDPWYEAFNGWLFKRELSSEGWRTRYLAECGGDHLKAIRRHLDTVAEFAAQNPAPPAPAEG
ncbi:hypothetical protein [Archangium violaceum]|uniref:hypothetical protein n=1 Tax=Archangium violaceum TaxID=83451 RepID=UPI0036DCD249